MPMTFPKKPWSKAVLLTALVGGGLVAAACWPSSPNETPDEATDAPAIAQAPTFTPYTVRPDIKNRQEVSRSLEREYPHLLRDAGIGGTVQVWFYIDTAGEVQKLMVKESSGHKALDDAALRVAGAVAFTPALNRTQAVPVWIALPLTFVSEGRAKETPLDAFKHFLVVTVEYLGAWTDRLLKRDAVRERTVEAPPVVLPPAARITKTDISAAPTFTPYTVQPDIQNRTEVARALEQAYPPLLRDAGIGGTAQVWFFINETGVVQKTQLNKSTGHQALDEAALEVARTIRFTAAMNRDKPVPVWISLPITFRVRLGGGGAGINYVAPSP